MLGLTKVSGGLIWIAPWSIRSVLPIEKGSRIYLSSDDSEDVQETPERIAAEIERRMFHIFGSMSSAV